VTRPVYPSSNELGVPDLLPSPTTSAPGLTAPFIIWGDAAKQRSVQGTFGFYTEDRRFNRIWERPEMIPATQCTAVVEPNFTARDETPKAEAIWGVFKKRWLSRHWQASGIDVWVDLFMAHTHLDLALLGVPRGWQRFATSGQGSRVSELEVELGMAQDRAAGQAFTMLVYGGNAAVKEWATSQPNIIHVPHRRASEFRPGEGTRRRLARELLS
jgi:hypothetical protein